MELENGDDPVPSDLHESIKKDFDSDPPPDEGNKWICWCFVCKLHFYISQGSGTGGEDTIKIVGESLGLNNWQTVAAIIGESFESVKTLEI